MNGDLKPKAPGLSGMQFQVERNRHEVILVFGMITFYVIFEVFTAVTMKNAVFWNVAPCRSCVNRRFGGTWLLTLVTRSRIFLHGPHSRRRQS
jgi:hypothetical protein